MKNTRNFIFLLSILLSISCFLGCTSKSSSGENAPLYDSADTIIVNEMIDDYFMRIKNLDYEGAINMLSEFHSDSLVKLSEETKNELIMQYKTFPVINYTISDVKWGDSDPILMTYSIEFFEKEEGSNLPNTYNVTLSPIRKDGYWHLRVYSHR